MKKQVHKILLVMVAVLISFGSCTTQRTPYSQQGYVDFQLFYDHLSPYGNWVDYPGHGYVWIPEVGYGFEPYATNGHWVMTEFGWTWVSNYRWGWAPFHYGRWDLDNRLGWFWVPDNVWGPAWVSWRRGGGYYGWAPLRPGARAGYGGQWDVDRWHFVRDRDFGRTDIHRHYINKRSYGEIIRNSSVINNTHIDRRRNATYIAGPEREEVQRVTGRRFNSLSVTDSNRPGAEVNKEQLRIYRPQVQSNTRTQPSAPARVYSRDEVKPAAERRGSRLPDNTYTPNERREEKMQQMERRKQEQNQINEQRQQRTEQRRQQMEQRQENNTRQSRPLNQPKREDKREERSQQIEQQPNQSAPQAPSRSNSPFGRRR